MGRPRNILFIMYDQLRWDYLSCAGHPVLDTPNFDRLAARGLRFSRAYVQAPICGASRMSTYTGRYVSSHGASWNNIPLKVGEMTLGDHLRGAGMGCWLVGKTHMEVDAEGMARLGLEVDSVIGARVSECGFDVFERDDGLRPEGPDGLYDPKGALAYNAYLRGKGYEGDNPWHDHANSGRGEDGRVLSGWFLKNSAQPANIAEEDSETPYLTRRGMAFMEQAGQPWLCHLSYIKPHWPYIVPEPYASMYGAADLLPLVATPDEARHPVFAMLQKGPAARAFQRDDVRAAVIPAYMGLVKQCDDQLGVLLDWLEATGRMEDTLIVVTSDHGDYLGDHGMGEKTFFHDSAIKVPLIIVDPSPQADATRGTVCDVLVESIDLAPTFLEVAGGAAADHILEGNSLLPLIHGTAPDWPRKAAVCEFDYAALPASRALGVHPRDARAFMAVSDRWKLVHFEGGFRPMLFDLATDPQELTDLGDSPDHVAQIDEMYGHLNAWFRRLSQRTTRSTAYFEARRAGGKQTGVLIGVWDEGEGAPGADARYRDRFARPWADIVGRDRS